MERVVEYTCPNCQTVFYRSVDTNIIPLSKRECINCGHEAKKTRDNYESDNS